jgi:hypothetical protein
MVSFAVSIAAYEDRLAKQLGQDLVVKDLAKKHRKMREDGPFAFLRATYWRWAETILALCPDLADAPAVLAIGDTHVENFGSWRDAEGRLVWGANDFDEAAEMPYVLDIVRLCASAILFGGAGATDICEAIEEGYANGLKDPCPIVLEEDYRWLRKAVIVPEDRRTKFWTDLDQPSETIASRFADALTAAMPELVSDLRFFPRSAGTGSLGRPRFVATAMWRGGPVVREVKLLLPPVWPLAQGFTDQPIRAADIAEGYYRAPDPHYRVAAGLVVRRLSPNSRKIEMKDGGEALLSPRLLRAMGQEIANCHAGDATCVAAIRADLAKRQGGWLEKAAMVAADFVREEYETYRRSAD